MPSLKGLVLHSRDFGYCKITAHVDQRVQIRFCGTNRDAWYSTQHVAEQRDFKWKPLPAGLKCEVKDRGICTITEPVFRVSETSGVHEYAVEFDGPGHETTRLSEVVLWPIPGSLIETPITRIANLQPDLLAHFRAREALTNALVQLHKESSGISALAASRIALLPHQAFVVGTVVDDPVWRYVLADEVGLGKTVEAGVIAHQLLASKPDARILVLCPGPLARQWLCEMHLSFTGRDFRLLDLHPVQRVRLGNWTRVISSIKVAIRDHAQGISTTHWDLVIVDEAHHLLWNDHQYEFIECLSQRVPRLLLLSAVPAREREEELLRLLRLIDPLWYRAGSVVAERFSELYAAQSVIGRRVRIVNSHLSEKDDEDLDLLHEDAKRLMSCNVLRDDEELTSLYSAACKEEIPRESRRLYQQLLDGVVARYRISRRILKNRRARLVDAELLTSVVRVCEVLRYGSEALEREIADVTLDLLQSLGRSAVDRIAMHTLFRKMAQAICDPVALYKITMSLSLPNSDSGARLLSDGSAVYDYDEHQALLEALGGSVGTFIDGTLLSRLRALVRAAIELEEPPRVSQLRRVLERLRLGGTGKILVFAGTYGTAESIAEALSAEFGPASIARFCHDLSDEEKEVQVTRFRHESNCTILISDESGGEGRNFQFADALVHFDLPWSVSAMEQRIGRLDRIGRDRPVKSIVLCPENTVEAAWLDCLDQGFGVFGKSISGLEFMLSHAEHRIIDSALSEGANAVLDLISSIRNQCDQERALDDADALTDVASFRSSNRYLHAVQATADARFEEAVPVYLRSIARSESARRVTDIKDPNLRVWRLRPDDVSNFPLLGLERDGANPLQERYGTFSRTTARERPDLDFFSVGHSVIDALVDAHRRYVHGRTFALRLQSPEISPGRYLSARWRVCASTSGGDDLSIERAIRYLYGRFVRALIDIDTGEALKDSDVLAISTAVEAASASLADLREVKLLELLEPCLNNWGARVAHLVEVSEEHAKQTYGARYGNLDNTFCEEMAADAAFVRRTRSDELPAYTQSLDACITAVRGVKLELDSIGVVCVLMPPRS